MASIPARPAESPVERVLDLFFPPICVGCRRVGRWLCDRCWQDVPWIQERACFTCGRPSTAVTCIRCCGGSSHLERLVAVARFEDVPREVVHALKFHGRHAIAGMMGGLMAQAAMQARADVVVPVPLHRKRRRERGYDQAALLARSAGRALSLPTCRDALERTRPTLQQASLDAAARHANVRGAFVSTRSWSGESILLVDDVCTTGATLDSAAGALHAAGAGEVTGLVFAYAM